MHSSGGVQCSRVRCFPPYLLLFFFFTLAVCYTSLIRHSLTSRAYCPACCYIYRYIYICTSCFPNSHVRDAERALATVVFATPSLEDRSEKARARKSSSFPHELRLVQGFRSVEMLAKLYSRRGQSRLSATEEEYQMKSSCKRKWGRVSSGLKKKHPCRS